MLVSHQVDVIVNFAAESRNSLAILRPGEFFSTNVIGTQTLLEAARGLQQLRPHQFPEEIIPLFITRALQGQPLPLYASTRNRREWLHVLDDCRAIELVLEQGKVGETYHVDSGTEADIETIADVLGELGLPHSLKTIVPDRPSHDRRHLLDSAKSRLDLGWEPQIVFDQGIRDTIAWYRENQTWWRPLVDRAPVEEGAWTQR